MSQRVLSASFGKREGGVDEIMSEALAIRRVFTDFDAYLGLAERIKNPVITRILTMFRRNHVQGN